MPVPNLDLIQDPNVVFAVADRINHDLLGESLRMFPEKPEEFVEATRLIARYAIARAAAMKARRDGNQSDAVYYEVRCRDIYRQLPPFARWDRT